MKLIFRQVYTRKGALNHYEIYDDKTTQLRGRYHLYLGGLWLLHLGPHYFNPHIDDGGYYTDFKWAAERVCNFYHQPYEGHDVDEESGKVHSGRVEPSQEKLTLDSGSDELSDL